jgi:hypothetical protein
MTSARSAPAACCGSSLSPKSKYDLAQPFQRANDADGRLRIALGLRVVRAQERAA